MRSLVLLSAGIQCLFLIGFALGGKGGGGGSSSSSSRGGSSSSSSFGGGSRPSSSGSSGSSSSGSSSSGSGSSFSGSSNSRPSSGSSSTSNSGSGSIFSGGSKPNSGAGTGSSTGFSGSGTPASSGSSFSNWFSSWGSKTPSSSSGSSSGSSFGTGSGSGSGSTQTNNNKPKLVPSAPVLPTGSGGSSGGGSVPPLKPLVYPYPTNQASNGQTSTNQLPPLRYPYPANANQPKQPSAPQLPPLVYPFPKSQTTGQQQPTYFNPNRLGGQMMGGAPPYASNQPSPVNVVLLTPGRPVASKSQKILTTLAGAYVGGKIVRTVSDLPRASYSPWGYSRYMPHYHRTYYYGLPSYYGYHDHYYYYHNYYQNGDNRWTTTTRRPGDKTVQPALNQTDFIALLNLTSFNWNDTTTAEYNYNSTDEEAANNKNVCIFPLADEDQLIDENGTRIQELIFECSSNETCCELDCCDDTKLQAFVSEHIGNSTDENKGDLEFNEILKGFTDKLLSGGNFSSDSNSTWDFPSEMDNMVKKLLGLTGGPPSTGPLLASGSDATPSPRMTQNYHEWENKASCHSGLSWSLLAITIIIMPVLMASVV